MEIEESVLLHLSFW